ncbi:MAG: metallophosphoesterase [Candidatus Omnitrophota bacterium]
MYVFVTGVVFFSLRDNGKRKLIIRILFVPIIIAAVLAAYAVFIEPNWIEVTHLTVKSENFTPELAHLKIVEFSDLHVEKTTGFREERLVKIINNLAPDIILFNGDFVNSEEGLAPSIRIFKRLKAKYGIYAVLGNTDYFFFYNENRLVEALKAAGVDVLLHDSRKLDLDGGGTLWIVGLSYGYNGTEHVDRAFAGIPARAPKIFLMHVPEVADTAGIADYGPQLMLAGHTHGGQFGIPFLRKYSAYAERSKYMAGIFAVQRIALYVNRGIGMKTRKVRLLCRPEITVIHLENNSN